MTKSRLDKKPPPAAQLDVHLVPRGGRDAIEGRIDRRLRVRVAAPPLGGRANATLIRLITQAAGVPLASVSIVAGAKSRSKRVLCQRLEQAELNARLGEP